MLRNQAPDRVTECDRCRIAPLECYKTEFIGGGRTWLCEQCLREVPPDVVDARGVRKEDE